MPPELTLEDPEIVVREPRGARERKMTDDEPLIQIEQSDGDAGPSQESELAQAREALQKAERDAASAREQSQKDRRDAEAARRTAAQAQRGRSDDHAAVAASAIESAKAEKASAQAAFRLAREAGDLDAEQAAIEALGTANFRLHQATAELATINANKGSAPAGDPTSAAGNSGGMSPASQAWIDRHPEFNTDETFRTAVLQRHYSLVSGGTVAESPEYFRQLDQTVASIRAARGTHTDGGADMSGNGGGRQQPPSGAPPSRGSANGGGTNVVQTALGPVKVTKVGGAIKIDLGNGSTLENMTEGAKVVGMDLKDYAYSQVQIALEQAKGGAADLVRVEDGRSYS